MTILLEPKKAVEKKARLKPITTTSVFSFFSGVGFLDFGFEKSGFDVDYVSEYQAPFLEAYRYSRASCKIAPPKYGSNLEDITTLLDGKKSSTLKSLIRNSRKEQSAVGFIGGPPCPDFSIGGKNKGHLGDNGRLSATYIELICQQNPDFYIFENVKGLWQTKRHREFYEKIKKKTQDAGYVTTERLINAIEYGAPQDRERIILFGFKNRFLSNLGVKYDKSTMMLPEEVFPWNKYIKYPASSVFDLPWPTLDKFKIDSKLPYPDSIVKELTVEYWFQRNRVEHHPNAKNCFQPRAGLPRFSSVDEGDDSRKSFKRLHRWRYSPTACYGNNEVHLHPYKARRISAAEALAIQSLPSEFVLPPDMGLSHMFKTIGNGVPFLAAQGLAHTLRDFITPK